MTSNLRREELAHAHPEETVIRARSTATALAAVLVAGTTGLTLAACGAAQELTAGAKIHDAFDKLNHVTAATVELKLDTTPDQLMKLAARDSSSAADGSKMTADEAKAIAGLGITVSMSADKPLKEVLDTASGSASGSASGTGAGSVFGDGPTDPSLNVDVTVHTGTGTDLLEYRAVAGKYYVKVGVQAIAALSGGSSSASGLADMQSGLDQMPPSMAPLKSLLSGKWVEIDPAKFADLAKKFPGGPGSVLGTAPGSNPDGSLDSSPGPLPSLDAGTQRKLKDALTKVLTKDTSLKDQGSSNGLDTIQASADNPRAMIGDIEQQVLPLLKGIPGFPADKLPTSAPTDAPTTPIVAKIQLDDADGTLNNLSFDFGQLDTTHPGTHLAVELKFRDTAAKVAAPAGAVVLDPSVFEQMMNDGAAGTDPGALPGANPSAEPTAFPGVDPSALTGLTGLTPELGG